jgi:hypothetical protein
MHLSCILFDPFYRISLFALPLSFVQAVRLHFAPLIDQLDRHRSESSLFLPAHPPLNRAPNITPPVHLVRPA